MGARGISKLVFRPNKHCLKINFKANLEKPLSWKRKEVFFNLIRGKTYYRWNHQESGAISSTCRNLGRWEGRRRSSIRWQRNRNQQILRTNNLRTSGTGQQPRTGSLWAPLLNHCLAHRCRIPFSWRIRVVALGRERKAGSPVLHGPTRSNDNSRWNCWTKCK